MNYEQAYELTLAGYNGPWNKLTVELDDGTIDIMWIPILKEFAEAIAERIHSEVVH